MHMIRILGSFFLYIDIRFRDHCHAYQDEKKKKKRMMKKKKLKRFPFGGRSIMIELVMVS